MSKKKKVFIPITIVAGLVLVILIIQVFAGVVAGFEIDGNTAHDGGADDWETVISGGDPNWDAGPGILIRDGSSGPKAVIPELDTFAKGGKFADPTTWTIEPGNTPAQNDLTNVYIYPKLPATPSEHVWMVMGMERIKKQGTFDLDFEYNQVAWDGSSGTLVRTPGDISIGFELSGNPDDPLTDLEVLIIIYEPANTSCSGWDAVYGEGWCQAFRGPAAALGGFGEATMNAIAFPQPPWGSFQSSGAPLPSGEEIQPFFFAEAAIDLTALGLTPGCPGFGSVHAKSRSSLEIKADLKDLSGPVSLDIDCWIDGYKFLDVNGDGIWDEGEVALEGWEIQLGGDASATTTTNSSGYYIFGSLSDGTYAVSEVCPTADPAWVQTAPGFSECGTEDHTGIAIDIFNSSDTDNNFGNGQPQVAIEKVCPDDVFLGDDIAYTITVSNPGNVTLFDVTIDDDLLGLQAEHLTIEPGDQEVLYPVLSPGDDGYPTDGGDLVNIAIVSAIYPDVDPLTESYAEVSASDDCTTTVHELSVSKDVETSYTRTYLWDISKSVTPEVWDLFTGETGTSRYTVAVDKTGFVDSNWAVQGNIAVDNPAPMAASLAGVVDEVSTGINATVSCPESVVPAYGSLLCSYSTSLPNADQRLNTATATLNNNNGGTTDFSGDADVIFDQDSIVTEVHAEVNVTDTNGESWGPVSDDTTFPYYERSFTCDSDEDVHGNTATIVETSQTGSASVTVNCYDLDVTKTANEFYTRYFEWDITKSVAPETWDLFTGESGTSEYTVFLDQTRSYENDWRVSGDITIANNHPTRDADLTQVIDDAGGIAGAVTCPASVVLAGDSMVCTYNTGAKDAEDQNPFGSTNTATATQQLYDFAYDGASTADGTKNYSGTSPINFSEATVTLVDDQATVSDTYGSSPVTGTHSGDQTWTYTRTFTCDGDEGQHDNTASFVTNTTATPGSDDASVDVSCYSLTVTKTADESYTRYYEWQIDKVVDNPGPITLQRGESVTVNYTVSVALWSTTDNDWRVQGSITIGNPAPMVAELTQITDVIADFGSVTPSCPALTVPAGGNLVCSYDSGVQNSPNSNPFGSLNTATATQQLYNYDEDLNASFAGTTNYQGTSPVNFAEPTSHVDEIITVTDSWYGLLGTANALVDTLPKIFNYPRTITAGESFCGDFTVVNTATFVTNDTSTTGSDDASVAITVPCEGCTPGFWQGGAGSQLWDQVNDPQWTYVGSNPFIHTTLFNSYFNVATDARLDGMTMFDLVSTGGTSNSAQRAARDMVAAYLNESAFPGTFPADSLSALTTMWYAAVAGGDAALDNFHNEVAGWNDPPEGGYCPLP